MSDILHYLLYLQHTTSIVLAASHLASCLPTFHRRGWCQLHQPQRQPWFQPTSQTHAPLLPGNGLWPVSFIHSSTWLFAEETYMILFSTTNRLMSSAYVRILSQNKEDRGRREGGEWAEFHSLYLFTPASLENWNPQSGRGARRQRGHRMTLSNSHNSQQCPLVHLLPLPRHIHICTLKQTQTYTKTHMHEHTDTPIAEQRWTSPDLTCSLICFRGDCLSLFLICCMYVLTAMRELVI